MDNDQRIGYCPHCGNVSTHRLFYEYEATAKEYDRRSGLREDTKITYWYCLAVCETCDLAILYYFDGEGSYDPDGSDLQNARIVWPVVFDLSDAVPDGVRRSYLEAARIRQIAPTAYAVQIRRSLEAICDDRGAVRGTLQKRLQDLAFKNQIPPVLAEMSEIVRVLGNIGAHANEHQISAYDAQVIDEFFRSIVEYVYEAPKRIQDFRRMLAKFGKQPLHLDDEQKNNVAPPPTKASIN
jgi:hypothetical protein